jgi:hypothetical protein
MTAAYGATRAIAESQFMVDLLVMTLRKPTHGRSFPVRILSADPFSERLANPIVEEQYTLDSRAQS